MHLDIACEGKKEEEERKYFHGERESLKFWEEMKSDLLLREDMY